MCLECIKSSHLWPSDIKEKQGSSMKITLFQEVDLLAWNPQ